MIAVVTGPDGAPAGIQRTYLTEDGWKAATKPTDADPKPRVKYSLGFVRGGAIRLGPVEPVGLALTEGVEDALSLMEMGAASAWAAAGAGILPFMALPALVRSVVIGGDADAAGRIAAEKAAAAFVASGREVRAIYPTGAAKDFNAELMGVMA